MLNTNFSVIIPARSKSTRLPNKPLLDIAGKPMIYHTWANAINSGANKVIIATDSDDISRVAKDFGATVITTKTTHSSGTERLAETVTKLNLDNEHIVVNLQSDEPLLPAQLIKQVALALQLNTIATISTLSEPITNNDDLFNPNVVKVITNKYNMAISFSRSTIPYARDFWQKGIVISADNTQHIQYASLPNFPYRRHIGLYAYRVGFLKEFITFDACSIETMESLEQMRALYHGAQIYVEEAQVDAGIGVDTEQDLQKVRNIFTSYLKMSKRKQTASIKSLI